jgi:hypothetical protein
MKSGVLISEATDLQPTSNDSKLPPLRRAALHVVHVVLRASLEQVDESLVVIRNAATVKRTKVTLEYIAFSDEDAVVRVMAKEAIGAINDFSRSFVGA